MPTLAANLSLLFADAPFLDRFERAARAGFAAVECQFPYAWPACELRARLDEYRLRSVLHNLPAGDFAAGERGLACVPGREPDFQASLIEALRYAEALRVRRLHVMAGIAPPHADAEALRRTYVANLRWASAQASREGVTLLIEPINPWDMPGYYLQRADQAVRVLEDVGADGLRLQFDAYHLHRTEAVAVPALFERLQPWVGHVQVADHPGRHEPGSGAIDYARFFERVRELGYDGDVGCEYLPAGPTTEAGLGWRSTLARGYR